MKVCVESDAVFIYFNYSAKLSFLYQANGCVIMKGDAHKTYVKNEDFLSVACNHLRFCFRRIRTIIEFKIQHKDLEYQWEKYYEHEDDWYGLKPDFSFLKRIQLSIFVFMNFSFRLPPWEEINATIWETIEECLESRIRPIQVKKLILEIEDNRDHILNFLDLKALRELIIDVSGRYPEFDVKRLKNLERLSVCKRGCSENPCITNPIRDFFHIESVVLSVETISDKEILEIKKV
uniref:FTH domain-containing protein n=1 Tax=Caenorhabditis tropicalis TaxID=1561998 RepID=A0A1I7UTG2_9PELO